MGKFQKNFLGIIVLISLILSLTAVFYFAKFRQDQSLLLQDNIDDALEAIKVLEELGEE